MKPITIREMAMTLNKLMSLGYGEHIMLVSDDEEGNGFHALYEKKGYKGESITFLNHITHEEETRETIEFI